MLADAKYPKELELRFFGIGVVPPLVRRWARRRNVLAAFNKSLAFGFGQILSRAQAAERLSWWSRTPADLSSNPFPAQGHFDSVAVSLSSLQYSLINGRIPS